MVCIWFGIVLHTTASFLMLGHLLCSFGLFEHGRRRECILHEQLSQGLSRNWLKESETSHGTAKFERAEADSACTSESARPDYSTTPTSEPTTAISVEGRVHLFHPDCRATRPGPLASVLETHAANRVERRS